MSNWCNFIRFRSSLHRRGRSCFFPRFPFATKEAAAQNGKWSILCSYANARKKVGRASRKWTMTIVVDRLSGKWTGIPDHREWFRFHRRASHFSHMREEKQNTSRNSISTRTSRHDTLEDEFSLRAISCKSHIRTKIPAFHGEIVYSIEIKEFRFK